MIPPIHAPTAISRIGLVAIALLVSLPFLIPEHTNPIPSFHAEWVAAALGLVASLALASARRIPVPGAALLALALAATVLVQGALGRAPVPQLSILFGLYLLWATLLACTGRHLAESCGQARLARVLATAVLAGSVLAQPRRDQMPLELNEQLVVEYYSR